MLDDGSSPAVFTPTNEPYLGSTSLMWFDRIIVWTLAGNKLVAEYTHSNQATLNELQRAACQIIPQGINIALSIRELLRQAYLFPAMVLVRPLIERAAIISYLDVHPEAIDLWNDGWKHGKRPSLAKMLQTMAGSPVDQKAAQKICDVHNHIVHGDPIASYFNLIHLRDGQLGYAPGKIVNQPEFADSIAMESQCYLIVLAGRMSKVFPDVVVPPMDSFNAQQA